MIKSNVRIYCNKCQTVHKRKYLKQGLLSFEGKKKWLKKTPFDRYGYFSKDDDRLKESN